jgi:hypothetical protein
MRFYESSEGGMKSSVEKMGEFEAAMKTIGKGVL